MYGAATTRGKEDRAVLYLALELGQKEWKLGFATGMGRRPRERVVVGGDFEALEGEIERAKKRFGLSSDREVVSCYEAGRDGFSGSTGFWNRSAWSTTCSTRRASR